MTKTVARESAGALADWMGDPSVVVLVPMVMAAPAAMAVLVMMVVIVGVMMPMVMMMVLMGMGVAMVVMVMAMAMMMMVMIVVAVMHALLRLEGALHGRRRAALPARQLREGGIVRDVDRIGGDFRQRVLAAEMPGEPHETQRVLGPHFQKALGRRLHLHQVSVLEPQGVAVVDDGLHVEVEQDVRAALPLQGRLTAAAGRMIEGDRIDDTVGLHGGLADDGGNAGHGS